MQTPEEKLLNIIRNKEKEKKEKKESKNILKTENDTVSHSDAEKILNENYNFEKDKTDDSDNLLLHGDSYKLFWDNKEYKDLYINALKYINIEKFDYWAISIVLFLSALSLIYMFSAGNTFPEPERKINLSFNSSFDQHNSLKKEYGNVFYARGIFAMPPKRKKRHIKKIVDNRPKITINDLIRKIRLIGIMWDEKGGKAIIEKRNGVSLDLRVGDTIEGMKIIKIEKNKVVFSYNGETATLNF